MVIFPHPLMRATRPVFLRMFRPQCYFSRAASNSSTAFTKAIRVYQFGGTEHMTMENLPMPTIGPKQVLVQNKFAGVNFVDAEIRSGMDFFNQSEMPITLGVEGSGVITHVGDDVKDSSLSPGRNTNCRRYLKFWSFPFLSCYCPCLVSFMSIFVCIALRDRGRLLHTWQLRRACCCRCGTCCK